MGSLVHAVTFEQLLPERDETPGRWGEQNGFVRMEPA